LQTAFDKFRELSAGEQPFALFLLTLDTHPPRGHETPSCKSIRYGEGGYAMLNAVHCADRLVSEFVTRIEDYAAEQRSENELVVIVASDHLMMHNEISPILDEHRGQRENLWLARSAELEPGVVQREATTLDIAPTVLSLLGWDVESMALGRNLLKPAPTLIERYGQARFFTMLQHWRLNLWKTWVPSTE
jgi:phosphoglycerol transferase